MPTYLCGLLGGDDGKLRDAQAVLDSLVDGVQQLGITAIKCTLLQKILQRITSEIPVTLMAFMNVGSLEDG